MSVELECCGVMAERVHLPHMTFEDTFHWDGASPMSWGEGPMTRSQLTLPSRNAARTLPHVPVELPCQMATAGHARQSFTRGELRPVRLAAPQAIDWAHEAASLIVSVAQGLLLAAARDAIPDVTGKLVWIYREEQSQGLTLYVHPVLLVHGASDLLQTDRVKLVPHLHPGDPLLYHMTLVLQAAIDAEGLPDCLYAEALTNALVVHFLRRYAACRPPTEAWPDGLSTRKLRRTTAYIEAHLAQES